MQKKFLYKVFKLLNHLETKIPQNIKVNNLDVLDAINTVKGAQLGAFPEMAEIRTNYQTFIEPYKNIKSYFKFNRILNAIKNKFGGAEGEAAAESILPKEVVKKIKGYRAAANLAQMPGETPLIGRWIRNLGSMLVFYPMISQAMRFSQQLEEAKKKGFFTIDQFGNIIPLSKEDLAI